MATRRKPSAPVSDRPRVRRGNEEDAERLRADLVAAAMQLFAEGGLSAVSVRAVASRVGVSPMSTYRYFAGKAELLAGLWESVLRDLCDEAEAAVARARGARAKHRAFIEAFVHYWETHPEQFCLLYGFQSVGQAREERSGMSATAAYGRLIALGHRVGTALAEEIGASPSHVKLAADVRVAMISGYLHGTMVSTRYPWSEQPLLRNTYLAQIEQAVERVLHGGLGATAASTSRR